MRAKYVFFTLLVICVSASYRPVKAGPGSITAQTHLALPIKTAKNAPSDIPDLSLLSFFSQKLMHPDEGIRQAPLGKSDQKRKLMGFWEEENENPEELGQANSDAIFYKDNVFENLKSRLKISLDNISTLLKKRKDIVLILGLDIDGTIIHSLSFNMLSPSHQDTHSYTHEQQIEILDSLDQFASNNKNVYIFYNTARGDLLYHQPPPERHAGSLACCASTPKISREIKAKVMVFDEEAREKTSTRGFREYKLPASDAIITGTGHRIEFESEHLSNDPAVIEINNTLDNWFTEDAGDLSRVVDQISDNYSVSPDQKLLLAHILPKSPTNLPPTELDTTSSMLQLLELNQGTSVKGYGLTGIAINKGTASRLLLSILRKKKYLKDKKALLVTAGDSFYDMPMINPVLEAASIGKVEDHQKQMLKARIEKDITKTEVPELPPASDYLSEESLKWLKSIKICDTNKQHSCDCTNGAIQQALSDSRVVTIQGQKLELTVQLFEQVDKAFRDYFAKETP